MDTGSQRLLVWLGFAFMPLFFVGFGVIAGFIPPPSPGDSAAEIAQMFDEDRDRIRVGMWVITGAAALLACFVTAISMQLRRIDPSLAVLQALSRAPWPSSSSSSRRWCGRPPPTARSDPPSRSRR